MPGKPLLIIASAMLAGCATTPQGLTEQSWAGTMSLIGGSYRDNSVTTTRPPAPAMVLDGTVIKRAPGAGGGS